MLKIWGRTSSTNLQKAMWAIGELGIAHQRLEAGRQFGVVDTPEYRRLNPNGLVPTIEDGDYVIWESNACVRYLYAKYGPPQTPEQRGAADKWMDWSATTFAAPIRDLFWGYVRTPPAERDARVLEAARLQGAKVLAILDAELGRHAFVAGDTFTIGDIPLGCQIYRWFELPFERPDQPNLAAWYARLKTRPAFRQHVMLPLE